MSWETQMVEIVRVLINDMGDSPTYTDSSLQRMLMVSAYQVNQEGLFNNTYAVNILSQTITPDPVDVDDVNFINMWALRSVCNIYNGEWKQYSLSSIVVRNGPSSIDMTSAGDTLKEMVKRSCEEYENYKLNVAAGKIGKCIITPFSPGSDVAYDHYGHRGRYFD